MKVDVVLPTYKRPERLERLIESVVEARNDGDKHDIKLYVYFSDMEEMITALHKFNKQYKKWIEFRMVKGEFKHPEFWNNHLKDMKADGMCYLNDDTELCVDTLRNSIDYLEEKGTDILIGFYQMNSNNPTACASAFGIIGNQFANRFPDRQVFCPDYFSLYIDQELGSFAKKIDKFHYLEIARILHHHPAFSKDKPDETHTWNKRNKDKDIETYNMRQQKNLLWGESFELVRER